MTDHAAIVREGLHACGYGSGLTVAAQRECFAALDALEAQRDEARNTRAVQDAGSIRKVEAYDAARAEVKRDGYSRAEYVLRAKAAEAERDRLREALEKIAECAESCVDVEDTTLREEWVSEVARAALTKEEA